MHLWVSAARPVAAATVLVQAQAPPQYLGAVDPKQRPLTEHVPDLKGEEFQEDSVYQLAELARISGEMPRASVASSDGVRRGGYDWDSLRIAGLGRSVLIKLNYLLFSP